MQCVQSKVDEYDLLVQWKNSINIFKHSSWCLLCNAVTFYFSSYHIHHIATIFELLIAKQIWILLWYYFQIQSL